jgi:hypothetical protein
LRRHRILTRHQIHSSAVTVLERVRGYSLKGHRSAKEKREPIEAARIAYLSAIGRVWPLDAGIALGKARPTCQLARDP